MKRIITCSIRTSTFRRKSISQENGATTRSVVLQCFTKYFPSAKLSSRGHPTSTALCGIRVHPDVHAYNILISSNLPRVGLAMSPLISLCPLLPVTSPHSTPEVAPSISHIVTSKAMRTQSCTLYALVATLTTGRCLRLVQRVSERNGFEARRQLVAENSPKTAGRRLAILQAVSQTGRKMIQQSLKNSGRRGERQVEVDEKVPSSKQDDDVTVSVVL